LKDAVLRSREKGLKATGWSSAIRAINTYMHWSTAGSEAQCSPDCKHPKIAQLKEPQLLVARVLFPQTHWEKFDLLGESST
jgi:hypothetical protein